MTKFRIRLTLYIALLLLAATAHAQTLTGRWALEGKLLKNGEHLPEVMDLTQTGNTVKGQFIGVAFHDNLTGTITGSHFELFFPNKKPKPDLEGDLASGELRGIWWDDAFTATPATAANDFTKLPYIDPPALRQIPYDGLAKTPPMGWNSWNLFQEKVDDKTVRTIADAMVATGMKDAGYEYVNIDDTWEGTRDASGALGSNPKFPDMKALADYVHAKGLKLGIYSSPGPRTCAGYPGSFGHEVQDAQTFAAWGIDYVKYDWCSAASIYTHDKSHPLYQKMGAALQATGRPIVFSLCEYGDDGVEKWGAQAGGNLWRTTGDINDSWKSMIGNVELQVPTAPYAGPGHWNDPDMLEIGNGHMTADEYRTHMSLWALVAAPLLAGNDIRSMSEETKSILLNKEVIAIDQDPLGRQASPVKHGDLETWVKPLADGSVAVGIVNLGATAATATVNAGDLHLNGAVKHARDLWSHQDVEFSNGAYSASVPAHATLLLRVSAQ